MWNFLIELKFVISKNHVLFALITINKQLPNSASTSLCCFYIAIHVTQKGISKIIHQRKLLIKQKYHHKYFLSQNEKLDSIKLFSLLKLNYI